MTEPKFVSLTKTSLIEENRVTCLEIEGHRVALGKVKGEFFAVQNKCSHAEQSFDTGRMRGHKLLCPLHGAIFDIRDGSVLAAPASRPLVTYRLKVDGEDILICLAAPVT